MPYAMLDKNNRIVMWSYDKLDNCDVEFSNGEYIDENCTDGLDDFVVENGKAVYSPLPVKQILKLEKELKEDDYIASKFVRSLVNCDSIADILKLILQFRAEYGKRFAENEEKAARINELESDK